MEPYRDPIVIDRDYKYEVWAVSTDSLAYDDDVYNVLVAICPKREYALGLVRAINTTNAEGVKAESHSCTSQCGYCGCCEHTPVGAYCRVVATFAKESRCPVLDCGCRGSV